MPSKSRFTMLPGRSPSARGVRALLLLAVLVGACTNPFKPADPEPPVVGAVPENWRTPEELLTTVALALASRSTNGATTYLNAFADSTVAGERAYRCFYDGGVKASWQSATQLTAPEPWDLTQERSVHSAVSAIRPTFEYIWQWAPDPDSPIDEEAGDSAIFHRKYTLYAAPKDGTPEVIAIGYADLALQMKPGPRWSIYRWVDRVDPAVGVNPAATDQRTMSWWRLESLTR